MRVSNRIIPVAKLTTGARRLVTGQHALTPNVASTNRPAPAAADKGDLVIIEGHMCLVKMHTLTIK